EGIETNPSCSGAQSVVSALRIVIERQWCISFGKFVGAFLDYDAKSMSQGVKGYMHIKVRLEVRCPVKRRKKIALLKDSYVYAHFCLHRITIDKQEVAFGWDVAFRATPKWVAPPPPIRDCNVAKGVWEAFNVKWPSEQNNISFSVWLLSIFSHNDVDSCKLVVSIHAGSLQQSVPVNIETVVSRWKPPDAPFVKINFDAGFGGSEKLASTGVIRDNEGRILGACCHTNKYIPNAFVAEALAGVQAIQFAADLGFTY
ncbi:hypothetical protein Golob_014982, partial [Gossypium lobatum]|nr:hypothetical protein [Gossypium lobatum]